MCAQSAAFGKRREDRSGVEARRGNSCETNKRRNDEKIYLVLFREMMDVLGKCCPRAAPRYSFFLGILSLFFPSSLFLSHEYNM